MMRKESPENEARLRRRVTLLQQSVKDGTCIFPPGLNVLERLAAIRLGSDGQIDLGTVDGIVRALSLAEDALHGRDETKIRQSPQELQQGYYKFIDANFGGLYRQMRDQGLTPFQFATAVSKDAEAVEELSKSASELLEWSHAHWKDAGEVANAHAETLGGLKAVFGGETFPQGNKNIVSSAGVYVDTVVLPDPFLRRRVDLSSDDRSLAVRTLIEAGLSILNYKEAALAELDVPLTLIVPDKVYFDLDARNLMITTADQDALHHINALFKRDFGDLDEATGFLQTLTSPDAVARELVDTERLLFNTDDKGPVAERLTGFMSQIFGYQISTAHAGDAVAFNATGRARQVRDLMMRSETLHGVPLIDHVVPWRYFNWVLGYGAARSDDERVTMHVAKALQSGAEGEMEWLGTVPVNALIEMRKVGALPELRQMLSAGVKELAELRPDNFYRTADKVTDNIQRAFDLHRAQLSALTGKKWRFAGVELGSCVVKGAVQIASACGVPLISLAGAALDQAVNVPKLRELPARVAALRDEGKALRNSAVGMLFRVAERK